jgi:hypothetical protein
VKKTALGWLIFLFGPVAFAAWDWAVAVLWHTQLPTIECFEPRFLVLLGVLAAGSVWGTAALRGGWGAALRVILVLGQLWIALVLLFFVLQPVQAELFHYPGMTCGDL